MRLFVCLFVCDTTLLFILQVLLYDTFLKTRRHLDGTYFALKRKQITTQKSIN